MTPLAYPKDWTVYLLHIDPPVQGKTHYLGIARRDNLDRRLGQHASGSGAYLTRAAVQHRSTLTVARLWHRRDHAFERRLKTAGHMKRLCPLCERKLYEEHKGDIRQLAQPKWASSTWTPTTWRD